MRSIQTIAVVALLAAPFGASAATFNAPLMGGGFFTAEVLATGAAAWGAVDQSQSIALPDGSTWSDEELRFVLPSVYLPVSSGIDGSDPCKNACSPFYGGVLGYPDEPSVSAANFETIPFFAVFNDDQADGRLYAPILNFSGLQQSLSLLWGSPDAANVIDFLIGDTLVGSFAGSIFNSGSDIVQEPGRGVALMSFSGLTFDGVRFSTGELKGTFEFSNVTATPAPVPLPPAILALMAALGALVVASRRRKHLSA